MATPRRIKNSPSRNTLLPRRNPAKPGMGGYMQTQISNLLAGDQTNAAQTHQPQLPPGQTPPIWDRTNLPAQHQGGQGQGGAADPMGVRRMLAQLGVGGTNDLGVPYLPEGQGGFGFDTGQKTAIDAELARIKAYMANHDQQHQQMQFNPNAGVAGNIQSWEQQLGLHPGNLDSLGATQGQQQAFGHALAGYGQGQPGQGYHGGQGGQGGGQGGGGQQAGQVPPQAGQMPYQVPPPPQGYSPGYHNPNQPQFQPPPQSYSPGYQNPNLVQQPQQPAPQQQMAPQGGMPPFQGASPGQAGPQGPSPTAGQAGPQGGPQGTDRFGFQPLQLPGWQNFINGYNQEMPQQPTYLTGEGLAQWQGYESALQNQLAGLQAQYGRLAPEYNQQGQRLMTNYDTERGQLGGNLAQSGIFNSGVAQQAFQNQQTDYNRQFQDLQSAAQDQLGGYYSQAGSAFDQTMQQLLALERQQAGQQAQNPNAPYQQPRPKKPTPKRNKKG